MLDEIDNRDITHAAKPKRKYTKGVKPIGRPKGSKNKPKVECNNHPPATSEECEKKEVIESPQGSQE